MSKKARFQMSLEILVKTGVATFPNGTQLISIGPHYGDMFEVVVAHPDFDILPDSDEAPLIFPAFKVSNGEPVEFHGWGLELALRKTRGS